MSCARVCPYKPVGCSKPIRPAGFQARRCDCSFVLAVLWRPRWVKSSRRRSAVKWERVSASKPPPSLESGLVELTEEGTPQGGPISPLLSNLVLDQLDRELEQRGHRFVRYADDCNIYVRSQRAGQRLMRGLTRLLEGKLKLKVNREKSAVARPWERKFLGFSFTNGTMPKRRIAPKAVLRFQARIRVLTRRTRGISLEKMVRDVSRYLQGWQGYFGFCQTPTVLDRFNKWIRRRIRSAACKQWRTGKTRYARLRKLNLSHDLAARTAGHQWGPWRLSRTQALSYAIPATYFHRLGLPLLHCTAGA